MLELCQERGALPSPKRFHDPPRKGAISSNTTEILDLRGGRSNLGGIYSCSVVVGGNRIFQQKYETKQNGA